MDGLSWQVPHTCSQESQEKFIFFRIAAQRKDFIEGLPPCQESSSPELADISGERSMVCNCLSFPTVAAVFHSFTLQIYWAIKKFRFLPRYNGPDLSREIERSDATKDVFLKRSSGDNTTGTEQGPAYKSPQSRVHHRSYPYF